MVHNNASAQSGWRTILCVRTANVRSRPFLILGNRFRQLCGLEMKVGSDEMVESNLNLFAPCVCRSATGKCFVSMYSKCLSSIVVVETEFLRSNYDTLLIRVSGALTYERSRDHPTCDRRSAIIRCEINHLCHERPIAARIWILCIFNKSQKPGDRVRFAHGARRYLN